MFAASRRLGMVSALATAVLEAIYVIVLIAGLASLASPLDPIADPYFTAMEILILLMMPMMVTMMVAVHTWADAGWKAYSLAALVFMALLAGLTSVVHFSILVLSREPTFAGWDAVFSFTWPSVVYALDILAWDVFFVLAVLFAAPVFRGSSLALWIRGLLITSGLLALAGLAGIPAGDMQLRNIGIIGYAGIFPVAAILIFLLFQRMPIK